MRGKVIDKEPAMAIIRTWCDYFMEPLDDETIENSSTLKAVMAGRVELNEDDETFKLTLRKAVKLENGESITTVTVKDPGSAHVYNRQKMHVKGKSQTAEMEVGDRAMIHTAATGQPLGVLQRMSNHDNVVLDELLGFFR